MWGMYRGPFLSCPPWTRLFPPSLRFSTLPLSLPCPLLFTVHSLVRLLLSVFGMECRVGAFPHASACHTLPVFLAAAVAHGISISAMAHICSRHWWQDTLISQGPWHVPPAESPLPSPLSVPWSWLVGLLYHLGFFRLYPSYIYGGEGVADITADLSHVLDSRTFSWNFRRNSRLPSCWMGSWWLGGDFHPTSE